MSNESRMDKYIAIHLCNEIILYSNECEWTTSPQNKRDETQECSDDWKSQLQNMYVLLCFIYITFLKNQIELCYVFSTGVMRDVKSTQSSARQPELEFWLLHFLIIWLESHWTSVRIIFLICKTGDTSLPTSEDCFSVKAVRGTCKCLARRNHYMKVLCCHHHLS